MTKTTERKRIVIVGGGFGGLVLTKALKKSSFEVWLIDKNNFHTFQPLLYQVATAGLEPESIATPFREIFKKQLNFRFRMAEVKAIDRAGHFVETSTGPVDYDYLVIASGSSTNYYGIREMEENALPMKSVPESIELRNWILKKLETALTEKNSEKRKALMTIIIIGGGPTGVELAGALGELKKVLPHDYLELDMSQWDIYIADIDNKLLGAMSSTASKAAEKSLKEFGIKFLFQARIVGYNGEEAVFEDGKKISCRTLIWTAGVKANIIPGLEDSIVKGRISVNPFNQLEKDAHIFAIGDVAFQAPGHPMLAPVAIQQARHLAKNLLWLEKNRPMRAFKYRNPGVMAIIGRHHGVVDLRWLKIDGALAWLIWLFVHLMSLVGFRNRLVTFVNWTWSYFTYNRGLRLIIADSTGNPSQPSIQNAA
jgi:NADH dehydrogenase